MLNVVYGDQATPIGTWWEKHPALI